jgi:hypothetical protein
VRSSWARTFGGLGVIACLVLVPRLARADEPRVKVDWVALYEGASAWLRGTDTAPRPPTRPAVHEASLATRSGARGAETDEPELPWFGALPNIAIVARDWRDQRRLAGKSYLADALRVLHSQRMVISRVRLGDGRIVPFAQLGLGQWRIDRDLMPFLPSETDIAGQVGAGFECRLTRDWELAAEGTWTLLYRESHEAAAVQSPLVMNAFIASRVRF